MTVHVMVKLIKRNYIYKEIVYTHKANKKNNKRSKRKIVWIKIKHDSLLNAM